MFHNWLVGKLKEHKDVSVLVTVEDNIVATIGSSKTLFSCHIDTVDVWKQGEPHTQQIMYDPNFGEILLDPQHKMTNGGCLGADDGVGVWIMLRMIEAKVPGTYVFHRGEERGGIGARAMREKMPAFLKSYVRAIAFDRPNRNEVIVVQGGQRCASETFGKQLAKALNEADPYFNYDTSDRGMFTDVKVYRDIIPECVNLGVGYESQHTQGETLDYGHALALKDACLKIKWEELKPMRDPAAEVQQSWPSQGSFGGYKAPTPKPPPKKLATKSFAPDLDELMEMELEDLTDLINGEPDNAESAMIQLIAEVSALRARCSTLQRLLGV